MSSGTALFKTELSPLESRSLKQGKSGFGPSKMKTLKNGLKKRFMDAPGADK